MTKPSAPDSAARLVGIRRGVAPRCTMPVRNAHPIPLDIHATVVPTGLDAFKARALATMESANLANGSENEMEILREAIAALPDRTLVACLPEPARVFIEAELARLELP